MVTEGIYDAPLAPLAPKSAAHARAAEARTWAKSLCPCRASGAPRLLPLSGTQRRDLVVERDAHLIECGLVDFARPLAAR